MRLLSRITLSVTVLGALLFLAWVTSDDLAHNPASFEDEPLAQGIAPLNDALTLARYLDESGNTVTLLVEGYDGSTVTGLDLRELGAVASPDPFVTIGSLDTTTLATTITPELSRLSIDVAKLLPSAPPGPQHLGIGTNFPEHAVEANSDAVFNFPKFGTATPARTTVAASEGGLLDYEVELCARFDRPITSVADFDAATKGVFLCADFTDRRKLLRLVDPDHLDSGFGFSDAKSGPGFFPTGPFLVIPNDWAAFVTGTRMMTFMNNEPRQDARGAEMTLDFRQLTEKVLNDMTADRFLYQDEFYRLAPNQQIDEDMTLMSGTSEGVIFTSPARHDLIEVALKYFVAGGWMNGQSLMDFAIEAFIENEGEAGHFLQPGDKVKYQASYLGDIEVLITQGK